MSEILTPPPVTTTRHAYNACHPDKPLLPDDMRYVDLRTARGDQDFVESLAGAIDWGQDASPPYQKRLFTGHRGCGKTTELLRLKQKLEGLGFFVIYLDVEDQLDLEDIEYTDLLLSMMSSLFKSAEKAELALSDKLLDAIHDWFAQRILTKSDYQDLQADLETKATAGARIPFIANFFASLTSNIKIGSSQKTEIRKVLERDLSVFAERLNRLIDSVRQQVRDRGLRDIVIIVDGLEKMPFKMTSKLISQRISDVEPVVSEKSNHEMLFVDNANRLEMPECHVIYTVPISLAYNANLGNTFSGDYTAVIPMVKLPSDLSEGYANDKNFKLFKQLVANRINIDQVFESDKLLDELIINSGGVVRDLMRLIRTACEGTTQINDNSVKKAIRTYMAEYDRLLRLDDFTLLKEVHATKQVTADGKYGRLLHLRLVLEYMNGKRWVDLHPLVRAIERVKEQLS